MSRAYLERFATHPITDGERMVATVMMPAVLISDFPGKQYPTPDEHLEIVGSFDVRGHEVLVSRMGALAVRPPAHLSDPYAGQDPFPGDLPEKIAFEAEAAELFNLVQCELALRSRIVTLPSAPLVLARGRLLEGHLGLVSGGGGYERTLGPFTGLWTHGMHAINPTTLSPAVLAAAAPLEWAQTLGGVSATLPRFILAAYSSLDHHEHPEALMTGWIVVEQLLDELWARHVAALDPKTRRDRLKDTRTYTAAVRAEVLLTAGHLEQPLYTQVQLARGHRNNLAHRAEVTEQHAVEVVKAMHAFLELRLGATLPPVVVMGAGVSW